MTHEQRLDWLLHQPWNFYYVDPAPADTEYGSGYDLIMGIGTSQERSREYYKRHERIDETGTVINIMEVPSGWTGIDQYNYDMVDYVLDEVLKNYPHRYFVPRIHLDVPDDWMRAHPEELCVYWNGPTTAEEIAAMVGTPTQDKDGWDCRNYNPDEKIARQSFSSKVWVKDASEALARLIEHIENGPYADQVVAYMPMFGNCGECMWWGDWRNQGDPRRGDFGISHKKHFYNYVIEKYGSLEELRKAWNDPALTFETFRVPTPQERWSENGKDLRGVLLADDQRQVDCNDFHSKACFDAIEAFGKVIKEKTGKPCGGFYGYTQDESSGYAGHLAFDRALTTPYVDFYSSPKAYHYCLAGDPGASQAPGQSVARKKLWIEENDMRSWHSTDRDRRPKNASDTLTCFWRELYRALTLKQGFWWMDIGGLSDDWYTDEDMIAMFKQMDAFYRKWSPVERKSAAEILFVEDEESNAHTTMISGPQRNLRYRLERELKLCGAPVDHFRVADMLEMDLSQYKFIVFCHAFVMPAEKWERLILTYWESKAPGTVTSNRADDGVLYWFAYVAGGTSYCLDTQRYSTGLNYRTPSIRADWLAKIGEEPKLSYTPDELIDILLRFQENDVNGNGLKDEVVCCKISNHWDNFSANFGLSTSRLVYIDKNGVATSNFYNENLVPYLEFMKKLYDLGLYDTSAMVTTDMTHELITSNRAAITFDYAYWTDFEKQIIQEEALYVPFILDLDGDLNNGFNAYCDVSTTTYNQYFVTSACKHPEAVGKLMDYIYTDHYALLDIAGTPETYTLDEQGNVIKNDMTDIYNSYIEQYGEDEGAKQYNYKYASLFNASVGLYALPTMNTLNWVGYEIVDPAQEATTDPNYLAKARIVKQFNDAYLIDPDACWIQNNVNLLAAVTDEEKEYRDMVLTDLDTYASELITNIILGRQSIDELDAGIKQLEEMGLTEIITIEQARYDRAHPAE